MTSIPGTSSQQYSGLKLGTNVFSSQNNNTMEIPDESQVSGNDSSISNISQVEVEVSTYKIGTTALQSEISRKRGAEPSNTNPKKLVTCQIPTSNRFEPLSNLTEKENNASNSSSRDPSIPPIFLHEKVTHSVLLDTINPLVKAPFLTSLAGKAIKIMPTTIEDYRSIVNYLDSKNAQFHTYRDPTAKPLSIVIKHVPVSITENEIFEELKDSYPVLKVSRLYNKERMPIPICAVDLKNTDSAREILNIKSLFHTIVVPELRRKLQGPSQCIRCQQFGHTKNYCRLAPRCVKCTGSHLSSACTKEKNSTATCVNCGENHPANFKGCSVYLQATQKQRVTTAAPAPTPAPSNNLKHFPGLQQQSVSTPSTSNHTRPSYSQVLKNDTKVNESDSSSTSSNTPLTNVISTIISQCLESIIPQIKNFILNIITTLCTSLNANGP